MLKRLFLSDVHIGDSRSQYQKVKQLIEDENPDEIYLVGDILDLWKENFNKIQLKYFDFLTFLYNLSFQKQIFYIIGNHEDTIQKNCFLFEKIKFYDSLDINIGNKKTRILHGHQYDKLVLRYYPLARLLTWIHEILIKIGFDFSKFRFSLSSQQNKSIFAKSLQEIEDKTIEDNKRQYNIIIMGHTHIFKNINTSNTRYINLGDWIFNCSYAIEENERIVLKKYKEGEYGNCVYS